MNNVELKSITLLTLSLSVALLSGCAGTTEQVRQPRVQAAVAKGGNTYVIKRASIRTPGADRFQRAYADAVRPQSYRQLIGSGSGLTREQYQARFAVEQRLQAERTERARLWKQERDAEQRQLTVQRELQRKELEAKRKLYKAKWSQELREKETAQAAARAKVERARQELARARAVEKSRVRQVSMQTPVISSAPAPTPAPAPAQIPIVRSHAAPILLGNAVRTSITVRQPARVIKANASTGALMDRTVERVIANAKKHIGTKYAWGGDSPDTGFDCSGLVQHSLRLGARVNVPRTAAEQYRASVKVADSRATRGDLVFFRTRGSGVSHVGIYLGGGRFLHAPRTGKTVTTTEISGYWKERLIGFGRIPGACAIPLPA